MSLFDSDVLNLIFEQKAWCMTISVFNEHEKDMRQLE